MSRKRKRCCFEVLEPRCLLNSAPVLDPSGIARFAMIGKGITDADNTGQTVQSVIESVWPSAMITDSDAGALRGIAVTAANKSLGNWQFSIDGAPWSNVGDVSESQALLLRAEDRLRFVPDGLNADTATATFRAWDQTGATAGQQGTMLDVATPGGTSPFSTAAETASIAVAAFLPVYIPKDIIGARGSVVTVPLVIAEANGLLTADITIHYDTTLLDAINADVKVIDSVWPSASFAANVDDSTGTIIVSISKFPALGAGGGSLMTIDFTIKGDAPDGAQAKINLQGASLNEDHIGYQPTPQIGDDQTDGEITVNAVNDPPQVTVPGPQSADEDTDKLVSGISVQDVDAGTEPIQMTLSVLHGNLTVKDSVAGGVPAGGIVGNSTQQVVLTGNVAQINATLADAQGLTYRGDQDYSGPDTLTVLADDQGHTGTGGAKTDTKTVAITVNAVNDAPQVTMPGVQSVDEDTDLAVPGISVQDVDAGAEPIQVTLSVLHGKLTVKDSVAGGVPGSGITGNGTQQVVLMGSLAQITATLADSQGLTYRADQDYNGPDTLTVLADDQGHAGSGGPKTDMKTVAITVNAVNDAPQVTVPGAQSVDEDTDKVISGISVQDVDAGAESIQVTLSALHGKLTVKDSVAGGVPASGIVGNSTQQVVLTGSVAQINATLADAQGLTYRGDQDYNGPDTLTVLADDQGHTGTGGAKTDTKTVAITVNAVNDAPQVTMPGVQSVDEDTDLAVPGISVQDVDAGAEPIQVTLSVLHGKLTVKDSVAGGVPGSGITGNGTQQVVLMGSLAQINATLADAQGLTYRGEQDYNGSDTLTVLADDQGHTGSGGAKTDTKTVAITVNAVNDGPQVTVPGAQSVDEDTDKVVSGISVQDVDAGSESIRMTLSVLHGKLTVKDSVVGGVPASGIASNGTQQVVLTGSVAQINATLADAQGLTYQGNQDYNGSDTLTVLADDLGHTGSGGAKTDTKTVALTVNAVNDAPQATVPGAQSVADNTDKVISGVSVQDVDAGAESVQVTLSILHGKLTVKDSVVGGVPAGGITNNGTKQVVLTGSVAQINATLADAQGLTYRGDQDYIGPETLTVVADDQGRAGSGGAKTDTKTVAIAVGQTAGIGGYVYADTNKNNGPDNDVGKHQWEGVPGALITLTDQAGKSWTTWTDDAGWYYFDDLPAGTDQSPVHYQLTERQPSALVEGGANAIGDVPLKGGQDITDQCFRELSLKPRYVYNRLLATSSMPVGSTQWKQVIRQIIIQAEKDAGVTPLPPSQASSQPAVTQQTTSGGHALVAAPAVVAAQAHLPVQVPSSAAVSSPAAIRSKVATTAASSNVVAAVAPASTDRTSASATRVVNPVSQQQAVARASTSTTTPATVSKPSTGLSAASQPAAPLTADELKPIVNEAIADWAKAGLPAAALNKLRAVTVSIADLTDSELGWTENNQVLIDRDAAGYGWFVDSTPAEDQEFQPTQAGGQLRAVDPRVLAHMDLLTVVEHELGHVIGLNDDIGSPFYDLMSGTLTAGIRRKVSAADIDAVLATYGSSRWA